MKKVSKFKSKKEWEEFIWQKFLENITKINSITKLEEFLNNLISRDEKEMIIRRLTAIFLIKKRKTYKEIEEALWISPNTISAIKKSLNNNLEFRSDRELNQKRRLTEKEKRIQKIKIPTKGLFDYWTNFPVPPMVGKGRWKFLNYQG